MVSTISEMQRQTRISNKYLRNNFIYTLNWEMLVSSQQIYWEKKKIYNALGVTYVTSNQNKYGNTENEVYICSSSTLSSWGS